MSSKDGDYSRIFMNVQGREPQGAIPKADYHRVREELAAKPRLTTYRSRRQLRQPPRV
ncbi:MAG: hypothetical protein JXB46_02620 [Candidatus Eisenbacteria bacterium]|nr:hypothetical protein [Candidatus Eisenbacteria bacterium]